jgi:hypothetical protein
MQNLVDDRASLDPYSDVQIRFPAKAGDHGTVSVTRDRGHVVRQDHQRGSLDRF